MPTEIYWDNTEHAEEVRIYREDSYFKEPSGSPIMVITDSEVKEWEDPDREPGESWYRISSLLPNGREEFSEAFIGVQDTGPGPL